MIGILRYLFLFVTLCFTETLAMAQVDSVMQSVTLDGVEVKGVKYSSKAIAHADGRTVIDMKLLDNMPQIMGIVDPINMSRLLPEIQTNGEYRSGINIQGCENSHNIVSIGSAPVYNSSHLLGFFSTFNAPHFGNFSISKFGSSKSENKLGGELAMYSDTTRAKGVEGEISAGLISSQGTIKMPLSNKTSLKLSLRASYINLLYGKWLKNDDSEDLRYSFYDANATLLHRFNERNSIVLDYYGGSDKAVLGESGFNAKMNDKWGNHTFSLRHSYDNKRDTRVNNILYLTSYANKLKADVQQMNFKVSSSIFDIGMKHQTEWKDWSFGGDVILHHIAPQSFESTEEILSNQPGSYKCSTVEMSVYGNYRLPLTKYIYAEPGIRASVYGSGSTGYFAALDPSVTITYKYSDIEVFAGYSLKHQYLFQTGISELGLPTDFMVSSDKDLKPQFAHSINGGVAMFLFGRRYRASANVFFKKLFNQAEYLGSFFDFTDPNYDIKKHLLHGKGQNYGFSFMLNKCTGNLTGWLSYTYTHARRVFENGLVEGEYAANHERPHELNSVINYNIGKHWSFGATFVLASGTPYTGIDYLAVINSHIIAYYKDYNSSRLKPYCRLDISGNYKWKTKKGLENGFNLSVYNATCHKNELFYSLHIKEDKSFMYSAKSFIADVLPSISYFCKF